MQPKESSRRHFISAAAKACAAGACLPLARTLAGDETPQESPAVPPQEASFYERGDDRSVSCRICALQCRVPEGGRGFCRTRENRGGKYYSLVYGYPCVANSDPIEKKPFFHVLPGTRAFSIATVGCNIRCKFCQNWDISQANPGDIQAAYRTPQNIAASARKLQTQTVAYTYSEPTVFFEYMRDCAAAARREGLGNVVISNGFMASAPLKELCRSITAIKIDLKAFSDSFYEEVCGARRAPVLRTLEQLAQSGVWFEIVMLVIPTLNDKPDEIKRMAEWVTTKLGPDVPLHFTRFRPAYRLTNLPATPIATVMQCRQIAMSQGCRFVYTGNMPGGEGENTYCPSCRTPVIRRYGFTIPTNDLIEGKCPKCNQRIPGVWQL